MCSPTVNVGYYCPGRVFCVSVCFCLCLLFSLCDCVVPGCFPPHTQRADSVERGLVTGNNVTSQRGVTTEHSLLGAQPRIDLLPWDLPGSTAGVMFNREQQLDMIRALTHI